VRDEVVLVEQIRIAAFDTSESPWLLEMVAGMVEEGETAEDVALSSAQRLRSRLETTITTTISITPPSRR
jgi:hypothetical protein